MGFRIKVGLRLIVLIALGFGAFYIITQTYFWLVGVWLILFLIIGFWELLRFLEKSRRAFQNFLISLQQNDLSATYQYKTDNTELYEAFELITNEFSKLREQNEANIHFLSVIIEHAGVPLIGYWVKNGKIRLINKAAKELLRKPVLSSIDGLKTFDNALLTTIEQLKSGERQLLKVLINNSLKQLSIQAKELMIGGERLKLIALHDIKAELDEQELESWQKLIRVLTHEIKNSAIPISTLTEVINQMVMDEQGNIKDLSKLDQEDLEDLQIGIKTVEKRSKGLVRFVDAYGQLARVPQPNIKEVSVKNLIEDIAQLLRNDFKKSGVDLKMALNDHSVKVDPELIEQVIINLLKNAKEALEGTEYPQIIIKAEKVNGQSLISIKDNGPGMSKEVLDNIFVPFYTTKKQGSGIGLSLSKQIIKAHKGDLEVRSIEGKGAEFMIRL